MKKLKAKQLSYTDVQRLTDSLRTIIAFIEAKIPADVIATKQTHGLENAKAALQRPADTDKRLTYMGVALLWAFDFVTENYEGDANELGDTILLLAKLGLINPVPEQVSTLQ